MIKYKKMTKETYRMNGEPCSIGRVIYTPTTKSESTVSKKNEEERAMSLLEWLE